MDEIRNSYVTQKAYSFNGVYGRVIRYDEFIVDVRDMFSGEVTVMLIEGLCIAEL